MDEIEKGLYVMLTILSESKEINDKQVGQAFPDN